MNWSLWPALGRCGSTRSPEADTLVSESGCQQANISLPPSRLKRNRSIELVEQTTKFNCGAAALAMILGLPSPEQVERDHMGRDTSASHADRGIAVGQIGVFVEEAERVLFDAGIPAVPYVNRLRLMTRGSLLYLVADRVRVADHDFLQRHLAEGRIAMLAVSSLNTPRGEHWIVVAGEKVFDPSTGRKYRCYSEISGISNALLVGDLP